MSDLLNIFIKSLCFFKSGVFFNLFCLLNVDFNSKFAESEAVLELLGNVQSFSRLISLVRNIVVNCKLELQRVLANLNFACGSSVGLCTCSPGGVRSSLLPTGMWE